jgi:geranylgeranyl diphosphate synthase type I
MSKLSQTVVDLTIGQHRDMAYEVADDVSTDMYMQMIAGKTAALAACATSGGALLVVGASEPQAGATLSCYQRFGLELGLGYQIRDDILGIWGEQSETGKSKTGDIRRRKKSFPIVFAFMNASPNDRRHLQRIYATTDELTSENESDIREILDDCRAAGAAQALVERQAERARAALSEAAGVEPLRDNPYLAILDELAGLLAGRTR